MFYDQFLHRLIGTLSAAGTVECSAFAYMCSSDRLACSLFLLGGGVTLFHSIVHFQAAKDLTQRGNPALSGGTSAKRPATLLAPH